MAASVSFSHSSYPKITNEDASFWPDAEETTLKNCELFLEMGCMFLKFQMGVNNRPFHE
jgi:hypothetical protein